MFLLLLLLFFNTQETYRNMLSAQLENMAGMKCTSYISLLFVPQSLTHILSTLPYIYSID